MTREEWNPLAHRALVTASLYGLAARTSTPKVVCLSPGELARSSVADIVVTVDGPKLDATALATARDAAPAGVVAVIVGSTSALGLLASAAPAEPGRTDAFARAAAWASVAARAPRAPAVSAARLREIAAAASSAKLVLVEPDVPHARTQPKLAIDRAVLATIMLGATARALLFVREGAAPKGGLARVRDERILDGWIDGSGLRGENARRDSARGESVRSARARGESMDMRAPLEDRAPPSLLDAARDALAQSETPMRGKDLLREARARWTDAARSAGTRAPTSSADAAVLAKELRLLWIDGAIELYAVDPAVPLVAA